MCLHRILFALFAGPLAMLAHAAPSFEPIAAFPLGPVAPNRAALFRHTDGNLYGVSDGGGGNSCGTIFRLSPAGALSTFVNFSGPYSGTKSSLVSDGHGSFWGTTGAGGSAQRGSIYKVSFDSGAVSTVVEFTENDYPIKGRYPLAALVYDGAGCFWGTTQQGGAENAGTIFKVEAATGVLTTIAEFSGYLPGTVPGAYPEAAMTIDGSGSLWGTAQGGADGKGTVFKVSIASGEVTTIAQLGGGSDAPSLPSAELLNDGSGFMWGTSRFGGANFHGTVFKVNMATGEVATVVSFSGTGGDAPGSKPQAGLVTDGNGFLWGTTTGGGSGGHGTVFKVERSSGSFHSIVHFTDIEGNAPGRFPSAALAADGTGKLWGVTREGGNGYHGTIFRIDPEDSSFASIVQLSGAADARAPINPGPGLAGDAEGFLWGTTYYGGSENLGAIFKVNPATGATSTVVNFTGKSGLAIGAHPSGTLTNDGTGFFWGCTARGGAADCGTIFKVEISTGDLTSVAEFKGENDPSGIVTGQYPSSELVSDGAGFLWGTTPAGGTGGRGTIFKVHAASGTLTTVVHFAGTGGLVIGAQPTAGLCADGFGFLWGTTLFGGAGGGGTVFKVDIASGTITTVASFTGPSGSVIGLNPQAGLVPDGAGHLWGTTSGGGPDYSGTVFKVNISSGEVTTVLSFTYPNGAAPGSSPLAGLVSDGAGSFWGTTNLGGPQSRGTIFKISTAGVFQNVFAFTGNESPVPGGYPPAGYLYRHSDGHLYGVTDSGGINPNGSAAGGGQIFRIRIAGVPPPLEAWKLAHLGHPYAPDGDDDDGDGLPTLGEYGLLRLPQSADAQDLTPIEMHDDGQGRRLRVFVPRDPARNDVTLAVEGATDLAGPWEEIAASHFGAPFSGSAMVRGDSATPGVRMVEVRDLLEYSNVPRRFLRVKVFR